MKLGHSWNAKKAGKLAGRLVAVALFAAAGSAHAESVTFGLSGDAWRFDLTGPLSRLFNDVNGQYDVGFIQHREDGEDTYAGHVGALVTGDAGLQDLNVTAGVGLRGVFVGGDGDNGGAIAPGVQLDIRVPGYERFGLLGFAWYAPSVTSFEDIDSYRDLGAALSYEIHRGASVFVGYRNTKIGVEHGHDVTLDNGFYGGIGLSF